MSTPPHSQPIEHRFESPVEDRHERTGSVKFADQADEGKEVRILIDSYFRQGYFWVIFSRAHYNDITPRIQKNYVHGEIKLRRNFTQPMVVYFIMINIILINQMLINMSHHNEIQHNIQYHQGIRILQRISK